MILGIDTSTYLEELSHGAKFFDGKRELDPLDEFRKNGVEYMRIRLWNDPRGEDGEPYLAGTCDLQNYIELASLAKGKGYRILLDFHYSDFWADPSKQVIPKAWNGYTTEELISAVYDFTASSLSVARAAGVLPDIIQVGNEITNGMLWPIGRLENGGVRGNYDNFLRLLSAGTRACREIAPNAKIMLHLERSNDQAVYQEFFTAVTEAGVEFDIIGASYYPYWHGTPDELFANLDACRHFGKEIMIAELGYGFTTEPYIQNGEKKRLVIDSERAYINGVTEKYPISPKGQADFVRDLLSAARAHRIDGIFYWEPLWIPGEGMCWASAAGQKYIGEEGKSTENEWANQCLFDYFGQKLPAFDEFRQQNHHQHLTFC